MTYYRVLHRNWLLGDYGEKPLVGATDRENLFLANISGDLRRLETDSRDDTHLKRFAVKAGITPEQAKAVLDALFDLTLHG